MDYRWTHEFMGTPPSSLAATAASSRERRQASANHCEIHAATAVQRQHGWAALILPTHATQMCGNYQICTGACLPKRWSRSAKYVSRACSAAAIGPAAATAGSGRAGGTKFVRPSNIGSCAVGGLSASLDCRLSACTPPPGPLVLPSSTGSGAAGVTCSGASPPTMDEGNPKGPRVRPNNTGNGGAGLPSGPAVGSSLMLGDLATGVATASGDVAGVFGVTPPPALDTDRIEDRTALTGSMGSTEAGALRERSRRRAAMSAEGNCEEG
mmetsp:Transcript_34598/g.87912  ORF Transcript_34598/g.87912 Transcript_34598/m.87912 type:complete len:268 (-) Transcript_34598:48-851(-)